MSERLFEFIRAPERAPRGYRRPRWSRVCRALAIVGVAGFVAVGPALARPPLPTTIEDFFGPGTQPRTQNPPTSVMITDLITTSGTCMTCHAAFESATTTVKPFRWRGSLHAHSMRDPIFQAAFVIANQDAPGSGALCIRCHSPRAWLEGRATALPEGPAGALLDSFDINEGVSCNICHRVVNPVYPRESYQPSDDELILAALHGAGLLPNQSAPHAAFGNANYVIDPIDVRRGPFDFPEPKDPDNPPPDYAPDPPHLWDHSPLHRSSNMCGTCHDVSTPTLSRIGGTEPAPTDTYAPNAFGAAHPSHNKLDQFPEQRTFSEWSMSQFAQGGVFVPDEANPAINRFGGNRLLVSQCQDCHMPAVTGYGCWEAFEPPLRDDLPYHGFVAANTFAIDLLLHLYSATFDQYTRDALARARVETVDMLRKATDAAPSQHAGELKVRITNQCGHKLLTGMPEGRRIWLNVRFFGPDRALVREHGAYDSVEATLDTESTKVYEQVFGIDESVATLTGEPIGPSFHLMLVNEVLKDNRIPPRGFTNANFQSIQASPVAHSYADGQHWDDTRFCIPAGAISAEVRLYYQVSSREYIEFLRDANTTDSRGQVLHDAWAAVGKSAPVAMDEVTINLAPFAVGDVDGDGSTGFGDIMEVLHNWAMEGLGLVGGDADCNGRTDFGDVLFILANWGSQAR